MGYDQHVPKYNGFNPFLLKKMGRMFSQIHLILNLEIVVYSIDSEKLEHTNWVQMGTLQGSLGNSCCCASPGSPSQGARATHQAPWPSSYRWLELRAYKCYGCSMLLFDVKPALCTCKVAIEVVDECVVGLRLPRLQRRQLADQIATLQHRVWIWTRGYCRHAVRDC